MTNKIAPNQETEDRPGHLEPSRSPWALEQKPNCGQTFDLPNADVLSVERKNWRESLNFFFQSGFRPVEHNSANSDSLFLIHWQQIARMTRLLTLMDPGLAGNTATFAPSQKWLFEGHPEDDSVRNIQCTPFDRQAFTRWLGQWCALSNWSVTGPGSMPFVAASSASLMRYWATSAWIERKHPLWCFDKLKIMEETTHGHGQPKKPTHVFPVIYRPWEATCDDFTAFLQGWKEERVKLGPHTPKLAEGQTMSLALAGDMVDSLYLLRGLACEHTGVLNPKDVGVIKEMTDVLYTPGTRMDFVRIVQSLEDRDQLRNGLNGQGGANTGNGHTAHRKRTI